MTLAAAFRGPKGGILLCSDQEWNDSGVSKRQINKNFRIGGLKQFDLFISGAGPDTPILRALEEIHLSLASAEKDGIDILTEHRNMIEQTLQVVHQKFSKMLKSWPMNLLIVMAPRSGDYFPALYRTDGAALVLEYYYYAVGTGKPVADYLVDRLYEPGRLNKRNLSILAAFVLREAGESSIGVSGGNMVFIHEGEKTMHFMPPDTVKEMQNGIPSLSDAVWTYWKEHITFPEWMGS